MKKILKIFSLSIVSLILLVYTILAIYLYFSETKVNENQTLNSLAINSKEDHDFILINSGLQSLKRRLALIDNAKHSIELEYFIYELDLSSQIMTSHLIQAARRGVKIKILVDFSAPVFKLKPLYAGYLKKNNIEVKYYNTAPLANFISIQHRSHRKLLIIDSQSLITGGRNIGDDYFDLSSHYNFLDSDIEIKGPIVKEIQKSFMTYWNSDFAQAPQNVQEKDVASFINQEKVDQVEKFLSGHELSSQKFICNDIDFVTDSPGLEMENRKLYAYLSKKLGQAKSELVAESPYFVLKPDGLNLLKSIREKKIKQTFLTNGLYSTDAYYTISAFLPVMDDLEEMGTEIYIYNGNKPMQSSFPLLVSNRWGLHAKRAVIDSKHTLVGTYNIDPRSANLNSEVLIACNNHEEIAKATLENMNQRRSQSSPLFQKKKSAWSVLTEKASTTQVVQLIAAFPLAWLFNFLL